MLSASPPCRLTVPCLMVFQPSLPVASPTLPAPGKGEMWKMYFLAILPLFFQTESTKSTKLPLPLCTLFLMGDLAADREVESCCKSMRRNRGEGGKKGATRWMVCPPLPSNIYCYRVGKKECGSEDNKLKKKHGEASQCLSCPTARWSTQDYGLHCTACSSRRVVAWATLFPKSTWNKPVHIFAATE